jgi:hypothetical protein
MESSLVLGSHSEYEQGLGWANEKHGTFKVPIDSFPNGIASTLQEALVQLFNAPFVSESTGTSSSTHCPLLSFLQESSNSRKPIPFFGFCPLRRFKAMVATYTEFASLGYAAPSGFPNLLALSSTKAPSVFFHTESTLEVLLSGVSLFQ